MAPAGRTRRSPGSGPGRDRDRPLRDYLVKLLDWEDAHVGFDAAVEGIPAAFRGVAAAGLPHTLWQLLEHLRLTQFDILDFCVNPRYVEPPFESYWPGGTAPPSATAWRKSVAGFRHDREALKRLAADPSVDLLARIPHGSGQTYLRELLLVPDHNAYHVGQIVAVRRALGIWK